MSDQAIWSRCIDAVMPDMLIPLYRLPDPPPLADGLVIRPVLPPEAHLVIDFVTRDFHAGWVSECHVGLMAQPCKVLIALQDGKLAGFACFDVTIRGFFGPTGVDPAFERCGIGKQLLLRALSRLRDMGFAYGIIGAAGPVDFYRKTCGAIEIPDPLPDRW